jgi:O-antigen ligase
MLGGSYTYVLAKVGGPYFGNIFETGLGIIGALVASSPGILVLASRSRSFRFKSEENRNFAFLLTALLILVMLSSVEGAIYDVNNVMPAFSRLVLASTVLLCGAYIFLEMRSEEAKRAFLIMVLMIPIFCVTITVAFFVLSPIIGAPPTAVIANSFVARTIGVQSQRQSFLNGGGGLTYIADLAAYSIGMIVVVIRKYRIPHGAARWIIRWVVIPLAIIACLFVFAVSDGRAAIACFFGAMLCAKYGRKWILRHPALTITILVIVIPASMIITSTMSAISWSFLSRGGTGSDVTDNPRFYIWTSYFKYLFGFDPGLIFGYGQSGQSNAGLSQRYAFLFAGWQEDTTSASLHNFVLQTVVEMGLVGLAAFLAPLYFILVRARRIAKACPVEVTLIVYIFVFTLLAGGTETIGSPMDKEFFLYFWIVILVFMRLPTNSSKAPDRRAVSWTDDARTHGANEYLAGKLAGI